MGVLERLRALTPDQRSALRTIDQQEQTAAELEVLEEEHLAAHEAYLRRRDRLLGREVAEVYAEIETARAELRRASAEQRRRFERIRMAVLAGYVAHGGPDIAQLELLPGHAE